MQKFGLYVLTPLLSFLGGFYAYVWIVNNYWKQELGGDAISVVIFGGLAFVSLLVSLNFISDSDVPFFKCVHSKFIS